MKVKIVTSREFEVEVNDPIVAKLDAFWRESVPPVPHSYELDEMVRSAEKAIEKIVDLPFGDRNAPETIVAVLNMEDDPILEW